MMLPEHIYDDKLIKRINYIHEDKTLVIAKVPEGIKYQTVNGTIVRLDELHSAPLSRKDYLFIIDAVNKINLKLLLTGE